MNLEHKFGCNWTEIKLDIFEKYLSAYTIALNKQPFDKIYIDAFTGSGAYKAGNVLLDGSVKKALNNDKFWNIIS